MAAQRMVTQSAKAGFDNIIRLLSFLIVLLASTSDNIAQNKTSSVWNLSKYHGSEFIKKCGYLNQYARGIPELAVRIKNYNKKRKRKHEYYHVTFLYSDHYNELLYKNEAIDDAYTLSIFPPYGDYFTTYLVECEITPSDVSHMIQVLDFNNHSKVYASYNIFYEDNKVIIMERLESQVYNKFSRRIVLNSLNKSTIAFHILKMFSTSTYWGDAVSSTNLNKESALREIECLKTMDLADPNIKY